VKKVPKFVVLGFVGLMGFGGALSACGAVEENAPSGQAASGKNSSKAKETSKPAKKPKPAKKQDREASDANTPHMTAKESVKVDGVIYRIKSARTATKLGGEYTSAEADGVFLVVKLTANSVRKESSTLNDDSIGLEAGGKTYKPDTEGTTALQLSGGSKSDEPFFLRDINPDTTSSGSVVYDVPKSLLSKKVEVRFNELGFGTTHGYIRLPKL
jgi:hypothetical protein